MSKCTKRVLAWYRNEIQMYPVDKYENGYNFKNGQAKRYDFSWVSFVFHLFSFTNKKYAVKLK